MQVITPAVEAPWRGFHAGLWQSAIDVRDFIQQNYEPYDGDGSFLAPATPRTRGLWDRLNELFVEERRKGVLDISQVPGSITSHVSEDRERDDHEPAHAAPPREENRAARQVCDSSSGDPGHEKRERPEQQQRRDDRRGPEDPLSQRESEVRVRHQRGGHG